MLKMNKAIKKIKNNIQQFGAKKGETDEMGNYGNGKYIYITPTKS
jgi:hypothetical protein